MSEDIEQRLAAAAQAMRERDMTSQRSSDLQARRDDLAAQLEVLKTSSAEESKDVERLEQMSLTRVLASMTGAREERLTRERAEAQAAKYRMAQGQAQVEAAQHDLDAAQRRLDQLASAPDTYAAVLAEKERHLEQSGDPRGRSLLAIAEERGQLAADVKELNEASRAARSALDALAAVDDKLGSASSWSTYDTWFGGGMIASSVKHSRLDEAAQAAHEADLRLAALRTELADVDEPGVISPHLPVGEGTRFADIWFDNFFTDLAVESRIRQAQQNVTQSADMVSELQSKLTTRTDQKQARLAAIEAERRDLLAG